MPSIIFDFDGTLVDSRRRLYALFCHLAPEASLNFDEYWKLKRAGIGHEAILKSIYLYNQFSFSSFQQEWMELIESDQYLSLDNPFPFVPHLFNQLSEKGIELVLLTSRQFPHKVQNQLNGFGWSHYFKEVWVTKQLESKKEFLLRVGRPKDTLAMIGDTGHDIATANELNIYSIAVLSGFHSQEVLMKYRPIEVIESVEKIEDTKIFNSLLHA